MTFLDCSKYGETRYRTRCIPGLTPRGIFALIKGLTDDATRLQLEETLEDLLLFCLKNQDLDTLEKMRRLFNITDTAYHSMLIKRFEHTDPALRDSVVEILKDPHGLKLLTKFPFFNKKSQDNILTLLSVENETSKDIDRRSGAYRNEVVKKLMHFKRNKEILHSIEAKGVDIEAWLKYDEVTTFTLGKTEERGIGEKLTKQAERIAVSLAKYNTTIKNILSAQKEKLINSEIKDTADLEKELAKLKEIYIATDREDEGKRKGIEKAIQNLETRISTAKKISVWEKIHAEFSKIDALGKILLSLQRELLELEKKKVDDLGETNRMARIKDLEKKFTETSQNIQKRLATLIPNFKAMISLALSEEKAVELLSQFHDATKEESEYLTFDLTAFQEIVNEDVDDDTEQHEEGEEEDADDFEEDEMYLKEKKKHIKELEGRTMSIRVGTRNRQDLYLGNDTNCCVRIDSSYHGANSPISDYLTDLGMQNVIIFDEKTQRPVAVAWCYIGIKV